MITWKIYSIIHIFQSKYQHNIGDPMNTMLINLKTCLPIRYDSANNTLYAELRQTDLHPGIPIGGIKPPAESESSSMDNPEPLSEQFSWIPQVINNDLEPFEYCEHGSRDNAIIYLASLTTNQRISKGQPIGGVIPAVLASATQKFTTIEVSYCVSVASSV
ncbi:uncharacterized protein [Dysidea avara]|uniref:uncharacterized protein n=1 Tax=Dysidea avara TaxID=196820 RepID=UPI0033217E9E